jgi:hypothetical protein
MIQRKKLFCYCHVLCAKNFQLTTPIHEEQKLKLIGANLSFEGSSILPQFNVKRVKFAEKDSDSKLEVEIELHRIFSHHLTNTFIPTIR